MADNVGGVRLAMPHEAQRIAHLQHQAWSADPVGARALAQITLEEMAQAWSASIVRPPLATYRILVATRPDGTRLGEVIGFAAICPSDDPDADPGVGLVAEFIVDAAVPGAHADQLLNAVVDTLRADGFARATWWLASTDDRLRDFLTGAGWGPDGAHRELGDDVAVLKQVRLHTDIGTG